MTKKKDAYFGRHLSVLFKIEQRIDCQLQPDALFHLKSSICLIINNMNFVINMMDRIDKAAHGMLFGSIFLFTDRSQLEKCFLDGKIFFLCQRREIFYEVICPVHQHEHRLFEIKSLLIWAQGKLIQLILCFFPVMEEK